MPADKMTKHRGTSIWNKATYMQLKSRDVKMDGSCGDMEFSMYGMEGEVLLEVVAAFK